jgi:hypothetical protein
MAMIKESLRKHPKALRLARKLTRRSRHSKLEPVYNDAAVAIVEKWSRTIPNKFDVIVGIPRSGLFLASVLALKWGRPLSTPDDFVRGIIWQSSSVPQIRVSDIHSILLIDDTIHKGTMLGSVKKQITDYRRDLEIQVATLFVSGGRTDLADYYVQLKEKPDILEWNLLSSTWGFGKPSTDLDGVVCEDCPKGVEDDTPEYKKWLVEASPYLPHPRGFDSIITGRREKYRAETEAWLESHKVKYERLVMLDNHIPKTTENISTLKIQSLKATNANWFWESDYRQAARIRRETGIPTLSVEEMKLYW